VLHRDVASATALADLPALSHESVT